MHGNGSRGHQQSDVELKQGSDRGQSDQHDSSSSTTSSTIMLSDEEMARRLHEELNFGPKVVTTRRSAKLPLPENGKSTEARVKQVCDCFCMQASKHMLNLYTQHRSHTH